MKSVVEYVKNTIPNVYISDFFLCNNKIKNRKERFQKRKRNKGYDS